MEMVVDIGNSRTKMAIFSHGKLVKVYSAVNQLDASELEEIFAQNPSKGIVSSVKNDNENWMESFLNVSWISLSDDLRFPFENKYATPETLGKDRIALASAAVSRFSTRNVLVIDAGTCVTYDLVNQDGLYLGGAISPGLQMRLTAMHKLTAKLPVVDIDEHVDLIGDSTKKCMQSGALHGLVAEINGTIESYQARFEDLIVVLTGGDTNLLAPLVKSGIFARQNFLLEGLHDILAYNTP
jgi:type III pantothenate kinase